MKRDMKRNFCCGEISFIIGFFIFFSAPQLFADEENNDEVFRAPRVHLGTWEAKMFYKLQVLEDGDDEDDVHLPTFHDPITPKEAVKMTEQVQNALEKLKSPACPATGPIVTRPRGKTIRKDFSKKTGGMAIAKIEPLFNKLGAVLDSLNKADPFDDDEQKRRKNAIRKLKDRNVDIIKSIKKFEAIGMKVQDPNKINHNKTDEESDLFLQLEKMNQFIYSSLTLYAESKIFKDKNLGASENLTKQLDAHYTDILSAKIAHTLSRRNDIDSTGYTTGVQFLSHIYQSSPLFVSTYGNSLKTKESELESTLKQIDHDIIEIRKTKGNFSKQKQQKEDTEGQLKKLRATQEFMKEIESYKPTKDKK